ncbi:ABC transporter permease [Neorhizobium galegae]|uniref:Putative sugar ABC transporter, permease protein ribose ABC transporter rbsC-like n=1 Tax=Neorhizobium galegae bv. orientalis str. HAMBI 540 TaxID=1028800 RepID=A0A068SZ92_NEOGA|nr:ABC transporter permease [Neorhizobium galegae]MCQ1854419.1 ABC transporter permease [Neorhizobium galegae]CDN51483.1 Putative sugar ABC transporter, permease protein; ribose ABC transporter rbsC-like [Neorhizobium galegae bv. orientalis str. HAMBI 540]CDZ54143.1 Permease component of ribose/xylose/arabinose/galactoside ABC-type transporter [Neorhizobium galegae bv. orientalis]
MNAARLLFTKPWIWSFAATMIVWIVTVLFTGGASSLGLSQAALTFAAFSVIVGIGQMFVITLGPGNIDLSVPATMTLSGTLALKLMDVQDGMILVGLLTSILLGFAIGIGNYALIKLLRIPPIIATLSISFIVQSTAIWANRGLRIKPPEVLASFTTSSLFGIPNIAIVALILSVIAWVLLKKTIYGRWISAIGQSTFAARMTGIPVDGTRLVTYILCAVLASICGYLLASFSGGAALNMGSEYLLMSIAVVVIGGTAVAGGNSNIPGIWGASLFMFLVVSMLNTYGFGAGFRLILTGLIIIAVILVAGGRQSNR